MIQEKGKAPFKRLGLAAEHRVISELLLRGFNPCINIHDEGIDLMLTNGKSIQVKAAHRVNANGRGYKFDVCRSQKVGFKKLKTDIYIFWLIDDDIFLIIPKSNMNIGGCINLITKYTGGYSQPKSNLLSFKDKWNLLT